MIPAQGQRYYGCKLVHYSRIPDDA